MQMLQTVNWDMDGYGLTTAQIVYRFPDHPGLLQEFVWQQFDVCPHFPALHKFLAFWVEKIEGPLHTVLVAHAKLLMPTDLKALETTLRH